MLRSSVVRRLSWWIVLAAACSRSPDEIGVRPAAVRPAGSVVPAPSFAAPKGPAPVLTSSPGDVEPTLDEPWNPKGIEWVSLEDGLARAKKEKKPVCLVLYANWCPHCRNYSHVFGDPRLVQRARKLVMVKVDADANEAISKRYSSDGTYVPRTFFLDPDGNVDPGAHSDHPRYAHFFDEFHADSLLDAMDAALASRR